MIPQPAYRGAKAPRTLLSESRAEVAAALLRHLQDEDAVTGLLDLAELEGDAHTPSARVALAGETWTVDLFASPREAAA